MSRVHRRTKSWEWDREWFLREWGWGWWRLEIETSYILRSEFNRVLKNFNTRKTPVVNRIPG